MVSFNDKYNLHFESMVAKVYLASTDKERYNQERMILSWYNSKVELFTSAARDFDSTVKFIASTGEEYCAWSASAGEEQCKHVKIYWNFVRSLSSCNFEWRHHSVDIPDNKNQPTAHASDL